MDIDGHTRNENIRQIEDIIDIQKANGNFNSRQVVFNLPSDTESIVSTNDIAKSLDSGLSKKKSVKVNKKKCHKLRPYRKKNSLPDVASWPSDSDITVLRMKLYLTGKSSNIKQRVGNIIPGDGLHQRDSSSMVNLATLIRHSQSQSKHSFINEEYLVPLTSWERERDIEPQSEEKEPKVEAKETKNKTYLSHFKHAEEFSSFDAMCSYKRKKYSSRDSISDYSRIGTGSKLARFLRLYFCPCCTCLYRLEKMNDDPSYFQRQTLAV